MDRGLAGVHTIMINLAVPGIVPGNYIYLLQGGNGNGLYRHRKIMTAVR